MTFMAYLHELNIPKERTLAAFQNLEVKDFAKPFFTVKKLGLSELAYEDYLYFLLSHKATYVAKSKTGLGLFAKKDIEPDIPILEYCGERISRAALISVQSTKGATVLAGITWRLLTVQPSFTLHSLVTRLIT